MAPRAFRRSLVVVLSVLGIGAYAIANLSSAAVVEQGGLRVTLLSQVQPYKLPRTGTAPISIFVSGRIAATEGGVPAQLKRLDILVNRHALLRARGLPRCSLRLIRASTTTQALQRCGPAVVGSGQFWAHIVLPEQGSYATRGQLLVFNGIQGGRRVLLAHIYTSHPFSTSFLIPFRISGVDHGPYGTELTALLPEALGDWGYVDRIKITLRRRYGHRGRRLSYFNAGCPALAGTDRTVYPLAYATFSFAAMRPIGVKVDKVCGVRE